MPRQLDLGARRLKEMFAGFTTGQKTVTALAVVGALLGAVLFTTWASKPTMVPLFSGMQPADASAVVQELDAGSVAYELADGGATVLVPQADVYKLRLDMSAAGLPEKAPTGYALLDEQGVTTSEFRQRVDYQRALEGELATTISTIEGVQSATVHLVMPEEALFSEDARKPSASVLVTTKPGQDLQPGQVQALVHLVSSSVEGLDPTGVSIADSSGRVLNAPGADGAAAAAQDARVQATSAYEQQLAANAQAMLDRVLGAGGSVVRVNAVLDFDERKTTTESFETEQAAPVVTEKNSTEKYNGNGTPVGGVLGPENVQVPGGGDSQYDKGQTEKTYAVGKVTEQSTSAPGTVQRLSVAVAVDAGGAAAAMQPAQVEELVAAAVGLDQARGDVIQVDRVAFDTSAQDAAAAQQAAAEAAAESEQRWNLIRTAAVLLVIAVLVVLALRSMRRRERTPVPIPVYPLHVDEPPVPTQPEILQAPAPVPSLAASTPRALDPEDVRRQVVHNEINELVEKQPDEVAQLLRGWLADRRS